MKTREALSLANALKTTAVLLTLMVCFASPALAQEDEATIRLAHLSADAPNVDLYIDDEPVESLTNVPFETVSPYMKMPVGSRNIEVYKTGSRSDPVIDANVELQEGASYTFGIVGLIEDDSLELQVYEDDDSIPSEGNVRLRAVHTAPDVEAVDISPEDGEALFTHLGFPNASKYAEIPAGSYTLIAETTGSGTGAFVVPDAKLSADTVYTAFATGLAGEGTLNVVMVKDAGESSGEQLVVPATPLPDTGGYSLATSLLGLTLVVLGAGLMLIPLASLRGSR